VSEELDDLIESKKELEDELKARKEEVYQVNEKLMNLELLQANIGAVSADGK
jgi:predicted nuclease with TOPRIM domain